MRCSSQYRVREGKECNNPQPPLSSRKMGKAPNGIAAAYLYIATNLLGHRMVQREISDTAQITEVTIRSRCKEMLEHYKLQITLKAA